MDFSKFTISKTYLRSEKQYTLHFDFPLRDITGHNRKTFDDCQGLLYFLINNPHKQIFLTRTLTADFIEEDNKIVVNIDTYQAFCKKIGQNGKNRTQAYLAQNLKNYTEAEKKEIIATTSETEILERIKQFNPEQKTIFLSKLKEIEGIELPQGNIENLSSDDFLKAFSNFLNNPAKQQLFINNYPQIQINILEGYKEFLEKNLNKSETFIQEWIDGKIDNNGEIINLPPEEVKKVKKSRCLIFGLEFISHKREGNASSKKFDILTRISQGKNDYVLIELKSPSSDVFKTVSTPNANDGVSVEYHLSEDSARAIPQISDYRSLLENGTEVEWQKIGLPKGKISRCLIIIGTKKEDTVWLEHFNSLRRNLSSTIEILTYTDLIHKLDTTISNLKENL